MSLVSTECSHNYEIHKIVNEFKSVSSTGVSSGQIKIPVQVAYIVCTKCGDVKKKEV